MRSRPRGILCVDKIEPRKVGIREVGPPPELQLGRERSDLEDLCRSRLGRYTAAGETFGGQLALAAACTRKKSLKAPR